ncbi:MAG: type II toxin-antitoxin system PemK/MazF family toxin [Pseudomonadota bacterium]
MRRGEIWWAELGPYRSREQTGRRPVVIWQSDTLTLAFQMRAVPKTCLRNRVRALTEGELAELDLATDEALGRVEPE